MPAIAGGINLETVKFAGTDMRSLGVYLDAIDGALSAPPVRGQNLLIPYSSGTRWAQKYYGERHLVLVGTLKSFASRIDMQSKVDQLKALFALGAGEQKLEVQREDGGFRYVMAEVINTLGMQWVTWPTREVPLSVELVASDPIWYGSLLEGSQARQAWFLDSGVNLDDGAHWLDQTAQNFLQTLTQQVTIVEASNAGDTYNRKPVFILIGYSVNPKITNLRNGYSIQVVGTVPAGQNLVIDCGAQTVTKQDQPIALSAVTPGAGQLDWMRLEAGENSLRVDLGVPATSVVYQALYSPAYL